MRNIIGQSCSTINIADIVNSQKVLLVKLPGAVIGEINASLLGMIIISKLRWAGMARAAISPEERKDYYIYVDEFQNFATSGFEMILAEARKFGVGLTLANQNIGQLYAFDISTGRSVDKLPQAIFGNIGTLIVFRVGINDAEFLRKELGRPADIEDLTNIKNFHALVKTLIDNEVYPPLTIRTTLRRYPSNGTGVKADNTDVENIRRMCLARYGRPKSEVEREIRDRLLRLRNGEF